MAVEQFMNLEFLVPFLFVFAIIFGALSYNQDKGGKTFFSKPVNVVLSLALSIFAAYYTPVTVTLWEYMPQMIWFFVIVFFLGFIKKLMSGGKGGMGAAGPLAISFLLLLTVGWSILEAIPFDIPIIGTGENLIFLFGLIFIIALFWGTMKLGSGKEQ